MQVLISTVALELQGGRDGGAAVQLLQTVAGTLASSAVPLSKADVHSALFLVQASAAAADAELGELVVTWKRQKWALLSLLEPRAGCAAAADVSESGHGITCLVCLGPNPDG